MQRTEVKKMPIQPFDQSGIIRGSDGIKRYQGLTPSLVTMLRSSVEKPRRPRPSSRSAGRGSLTASYGIAVPALQEA